MRQQENADARPGTPVTTGSPIGDRAAPGSAARVAAIDVGSNAIRFVAAEFTGRDRYTVLESSRAEVRLGAGAFGGGMLDPEATRRAADAIAGFRARMEALGVERYRAVATSAVRDSRNGSSLVEAARAAGVELETITGEEEARLVWVAVRERVPAAESRWLLVDLGGGSLEISLADAERIHWSESHPVGAVRLLDAAAEAGAVDAEAMRRRIESLPEVLELLGAARRAAPAPVVATGGNIDALADIVGRTEPATGGELIDRPRLRELIPTLGALTAEERMRRFGLRADRADVIYPAALLYEAIAAAAGSDEIRAPGVGVKEGLILDLGRGRGERGADAPTRSLSILVADDEASLRLAVAIFLRRRGHRVTEAPDADTALRIARTEHFDAALVDARMPGNGLRLLDELDRIPALRGRTALMTGDPGRSRNAHDLAAGRPYLLKPFDMQAAVALMEDLGTRGE